MKINYEKMIKLIKIQQNALNWNNDQLIISLYILKNKILNILLFLKLILYLKFLNKSFIYIHI